MKNQPSLAAVSSFSWPRLLLLTTITSCIGEIITTVDGFSLSLFQKCSSSGRIPCHHPSVWMGHTTHPFPLQRLFTTHIYERQQQQQQQQDDDDTDDAMGDNETIPATNDDTITTIDKEDNDDSSSLSSFSLDEFLDRPFFDPDAFEDGDTSTLLGKLAQFVKSDYELAETLYVGVFFFVLVIISQELLRLQLHGSQYYVPFQSSSSTSGGKLF